MPIFKEFIFFLNNQPSFPLFPINCFYSELEGEIGLHKGLFFRDNEPQWCTKNISGFV